MISVIVRVLIYVFAILFGTRMFLWIVFEVTKKDTLDGMNYFALKEEYERLKRNHMYREKKRSMK